MNFMISYLRAFACFVDLFVRIVFHQFAIKRFVKQLEYKLEQEGFQLSAHQKKRISAHCVIALMNNLWFYYLRGTKPSGKQRQAELYIGSLAPVVDDLQDEQGYSFSTIIEICNGLKSYSGSDECLLYLIWEGLLSNVGNKAELTNLFLEVGNSQQESLKQLDGQLSMAQLHNITQKKGADATYFFQSIQNQNNDPCLKQFIFKLGAFLQYENDCFDVYKDLQEGVQTPMLTMQNVKEYRFLMEQKIEELNAIFTELNYPRRFKRRAIFAINAVVTRVFVCLDQLGKLPEDVGGGVSFDRFDRSELVCDMEKLSNIFANIWYTAKYKYR